MKDFNEEYYMTASKEEINALDWYYISNCQKLSENFIEKFQDNVKWNCISQYQKLSENFIEKFQDKVNKDILGDSWHYKDIKFKKKVIKKTKLYECYEDYFIAYKGIRDDRYSKLNFQYQYIKDGIYESHADASSEENSFGLSAWTYEKASEYCSELVVKVKIKYEDVARIVHDNGKIRCFKLEVLE